MTCVGSTWLTPGHPVRICKSSFLNQNEENESKMWVRPVEIVKPVALEIDYVYNFVVENRSSLFVNGLEVCTLGQFCEGIDEITPSNPHNFFGSEEVVQSLERSGNN